MSDPPNPQQGAVPSTSDDGSAVDGEDRTEPRHSPSSLDEWRLGPLIIEKRTSFTALAAFLIAVFGVVSLFRGFLFGPELHVSGIPQIFIYKQMCFKDMLARGFITVGVPLYLANIGEKDYYLILKTIKADLTVVSVQSSGGINAPCTRGRRGTRPSCAALRGSPSASGPHKNSFSYEAVEIAKFSRYGAVLKNDLCPQDNPAGFQVIHDLKIEELGPFHDTVLSHGQQLRQDVIFQPSVAPDARFDGSNGNVFRNYLWADDFIKQASSADFTVDLTMIFQIANEGWIDWLLQQIFGTTTIRCRIPFDEGTRNTILSRGYTSRQASCRYQ